MASLITKIGADSSQLRQDVGELPGVVKKSFDKMKDASSGGLEDNVRSLKRGFNDLKELFLGAGIAEGVKKFFDVAIDAAKKSTDANDQNAAAVRRFADGLEAIKSAAANVAVLTVGTFNRLGEAIGTVAQGIGAAIKGNFDSWADGLELVDRTEQQAREAENRLAEAKKHAAEFNKLNEESKNLSEQKAAAERKLLPIAEQKAVLQQKLLEAQRAEIDAGDNALEKRKAQVEQMKIGNALLEVQKSINDEQDKQDEKRRAEAEALNKTIRDGMDVTTKIKLLKDDIAIAEEKIASGTLSSKAAEEQAALVASKRNELQATLNKEAEKEADIRKRSALDVEDQIAVEQLLMKGAGARTGEENRRLELFKLQTDEKRTHVQIEDLLAKKVKEGLLPEEQKRLETLVKQDDKLKTQIEIKGDLIKSTKDQVVVDKALTDEQEKQLELAKQKFAVQQKSLGISFKSSSDLSGISTTALEGMLQRDQQRAEDLRNPANNYLRGGPVIYLDRLEAARLEAEAENIKKELAQRAEITNYARRFGETATIRQYGDTLAERALSDVRDTSTRTANSIETIADAITQSPIFRR